MTTYIVKGYPFVRCRADVIGEDGRCVDIDSWRPGAEFEPGDDYERACAVADGIGTMTLVEISRHKPGKYPERVFYTRSFETPDGVIFGKTCLRVCVAEKFKRLCAGYAHEFYVDGSIYK